MTMQVNQKQVLKTILTDCANNYGENPTQELKSLPDDYCTEPKTGNPNSDHSTASAAIEEACVIKPKDEHPLGLLR